MRTIGGLLTIAMVASLGACAASGGDEQGRAEFAAMLRIEEVPGVLLASYANYFQIDPAAPEQEIVDTVMAAREIVLDLDEESRRDLTVFAVYPGDWTVDTEFTTRVIDDGEKFESDVRTWASLLDEGFESVRYNVFDETGDGVLNINQRDPGEPTPPMSEVFDAMVSALGDGPHEGLQTEAWVGNLLATNRSGAPQLPAGWGPVLDAVNDMDYLSSSNAGFELDGFRLQLRGTGDLTPDQFAEIMALLTANGVLQPDVLVTYSAGQDGPVTTLFGMSQ